MAVPSSLRGGNGTAWQQNAMHQYWKYSEKRVSLRHRPAEAGCEPSGHPWAVCLQELITTKGSRSNPRGWKVQGWAVYDHLTEADKYAGVEVFTTVQAALEEVSRRLSRGVTEEVERDAQ